jgi:hypothetical protein
MIIAKRVVRALTVFGLLATATPVSAQAVDASFQADVERLLEVTDSARLGRQMAALAAQQTLEMARKANPGIPQQAFEIARTLLDEEFAKMFAGPDSIVPQIAAIYATHFTHDEVRGLLAFYETDLGRKVVRALPAITQESALVGQRWAVQRMPAIVAELEKRFRAEGFVK